MNYENACKLAMLLSPEYCKGALQWPLEFDNGNLAPVSIDQPEVIVFVPKPKSPATVLCKIKIRQLSENDPKSDPPCFIIDGSECPEKLDQIDLPMRNISPLLK